MKVQWITENGFFCDSHIILEADSKHPDLSEDVTGNGLAKVAGFFAHRLQHQYDRFINVVGRKASLKLPAIDARLTSISAASTSSFELQK